LPAARLLADAEARATRLLESSRAGLDALTTLLVERETISGQDIAEMPMELDTEPAAIGSQTH
jgi:ATP-dependent Zn protease